MNTIKIAIAGVGNCASSLIQGVQFYKDNKDFKHGLTYEDIGGYTAENIEFVVGFDVDARKVGKQLHEAIWELPNCAMKHVDDVSSVCDPYSKVHRGPTLDGIAEHMHNLPAEISFLEDKDLAPVTAEEYRKILTDKKIDILLNYMPVGSNEASTFYIENAIMAGVHVVNCMPSYIATEDAMRLEKLAIDAGVTIVGSDMRSAFGASRLSEILQGTMIDSGLTVTTHVQENKALGCTQGQEGVILGTSANTDFLNMAMQERLKNKHISKENVLTGQNVVRGVSTAGTTMYAGPSLTVFQRPGGEYRGSDNKIANIDMVAFGWGGARYELQARLSVQDSPNSAGIVFDAVRFCKVAQELGVVGYLRGPSAWTQKTSPTQMTTADAKFECDALARRVITPLVQKQLAVNNPKVEDLDYTMQAGKTSYE